MAEVTPTTPVTIDQDQAALIRSELESYGLGALWDVVREYLLDGYSDPEAIFRQIENDDNYKRLLYQRFPALENLRKENQSRASRGEPPIAVPSPAQYVQMERGYADALQGMPGNWASKANITQWISSGVSVEQVDKRVATAKDYIDYNLNPQVKAELRDIYGLTDADMLNYVLSDPRRQEELQAEFDVRMKQATVGGAAQSRGLGISDSLRDEIASSSDSVYTFGQAAAGFESVAAEADDYARLSAISGINTSRDDLIREEFNLAGGSSTTKVKKRLASQERGRFSGSSAIGANSLRVSGIGTQ